jgi:alpha-glucuronidase
MGRKGQAFQWEFVIATLFAFTFTTSAQTADQAWLRHGHFQGLPPVPVRVQALGHEPLVDTAVTELIKGIDNLHRSSPSIAGNSEEAVIVLGTVQQVRSAYPSLNLPNTLPSEAFWIAESHPAGKQLVVVAGGSERGILYGAFALLRTLAQGNSVPQIPIEKHPAYSIRWVDEWDNPDGSIERGYAGRSIFFEGGSVRQDLAPVAEYARLLASVGINGCNVNNVNGASPFLRPPMLLGLARIADAMRPWGVRLAIGVDLASPQTIGGLATYDPLDPAVKAWWAARANEIYKLIPDFAGFTVKADSEGQPGPSSFGRTPADAANTLAAALQPHGGIVLYRAFVYNHHLDWRDPKADRARAAYDIFHPLDGRFAPNVVIQTKLGPIDFQVREPVSPLFSGLEYTNQAMELQITQEYTGQQRHLVYLAPMWKQTLDFDLRVGGSTTPVRGILARKGLGGMVAVAGVGRDAWLGSPLALANLYAFGRLAWNPNLTSRQIAEEWTRQTLNTDPEVVRTVTNMLMQGWPDYENYTGPLGLQTLTDITGSHYGPNIESSENNGWGQWHRADKKGVGMDRTVATGTGFAAQYPPEVARIYESLQTCPDELLLFFHHVPYTYRLHSGKTVIQYIYDSHYEGAARAAQLASDWKTLEGRIDQPLYEKMRDRLVYQAGHAIVWRDAVVQYFLKLSGIPDQRGRAGHYPSRMEAEDARLTGYKIVDVAPWEDASGGKAVSCQPSVPTGTQSTTSQAAQKLVRAVGRDFSPGAKAAQSTGPLGPEVRFLDASPKNRPFPAASLAFETTQSCAAEWTYTGAPGRFDIAAQYFDLPGGTARFTLKVNGQLAASWIADAALPSRLPNGDNSTRRTVNSVELHPGDALRIEAIPGKHDPAALDYIEILPAAPTP